jgi:hypothetical protein
MNGLLSGFYIGGEVGRQLANVKQLKDSDVVWSIPVFVLSFLNNPAPLLLYDTILIDDRITPLTINFLLNDNSLLSRQFPHEQKETLAKRLENLLNSEIFKTIRFETLLSPEDINNIREGAKSKINSNRFQEEVGQLKLVYGANYAVPNPLQFEAMNSELLWQISKKLSETNQKVAILDDCIRGRMYKNKVYEIVSEKTRADVAKTFLDKLLTYIAGLPEIKLTNVESFIELHRSSAIKHFREIITKISLEINERQRDRLINCELYRANQEFLKPHTNNVSKINLFGLLLGLGGSSFSFINDLSWLTGIGFATSTFTALSLLKEIWESLAHKQKYDWFVRLKSFAEQQAGYD